MDNSRVSEQIKDLISKNNSIGIAVGKNPEVDSMAGALSLFLAIKSQGKNVNIVCPTDVLVEHSRLVGIDKVRRDFETQGGDMTVSFPYQEGEIEKISYTLESGFLNIIVKAGEEGLSFAEKDVVFKRSEGYPTLLFVIGTPRLSELDRIYDPQALKDSTVINIDNKSDNQGFGDISMVSPNSSSIAEKIAELMLSMGLNFDIDVAQNLLLGIESATGDFQSAKTTPLAFEMTGELIRKGAVRSGGSNVSQNIPSDLSNASEDYYDEEEDSLAGRSFPGQKFSPVRQPYPSQRFPRQQFPQRPAPQNAGQTLQNLRNLQNPLVGSASSPRAGSGQARQGLPSDKKDSAKTQEQDKKGKNPPTDWLAPKIYKGSTNI